MISTVALTSCCAPLIPILEKNAKPIAMILAALVFTAGAATAGVTLAGYLPYPYLYSGIGVIALESVIVGVFLLASLCSKTTLASADHSNHHSVGLSVEACTLTEETEEPAIVPVRVEDAPIKSETTNAVLDGWLPDEVWVRIFEHLDTKDLGSVLFTSKKWNQLAQTNSLWSPQIVERDWHEDQPECFQAWRSLHALKRKTEPKNEDAIHLSCQLNFTACSGNHMVYYNSKSNEIEVWKIEKGKLTQRAQRVFPDIGTSMMVGYYGQTVYILPFMQHELYVWDLVKDNTTKLDLSYLDYSALILTDISVDSSHIILRNLNKVYCISRKDFKLLRIMPIKKGSVFTYKNKIIFQRIKDNIPFKDDILIVGDVLAGTEKVILKLEHNAYRTESSYYFVNDGVLFIQSFQYKAEGDCPILRYDLDKDEWLPQIHPGKNYRIIGALAGLIFLVNLLDRIQILDFRNDTAAADTSAV